MVTWGTPEGQDISHRLLHQVLRQPKIIKNDDFRPFGVVSLKWLFGMAENVPGRMLAASSVYTECFCINNAKPPPLFEEQWYTNTRNLSMFHISLIPAVQSYVLNMYTTIGLVVKWGRGHNIRPKIIQKYHFLPQMSTGNILGDVKGPRGG